jgi:hypothetical protein
LELNMPNVHVLRRLEGIQDILNGVHRHSDPLSPASKGQERQAFIEDFLAKVLPPIYRFGTGDATDAAGNRSGQLDVVVEYPFAPSLPAIGSGKTRLYLAESVAAVVEVTSQWEEVVRTATQLAPLRRYFPTAITMGNLSESIPLLVAGYTGWKEVATAQRHLQQAPNIAGVLVIDSGIFVRDDGLVATGPWSLWGLISTLHEVTSGLQSASSDPHSYAR